MRKRNKNDDRDDTISKRPASPFDGGLAGQRTVLLRIEDDGIEQMELSDAMRCYLGRYEGGQQDNAIDLSPYGAAERGVSRNHAQLHLDGQRLYVTDFDSANGTFVRGKRVQPHTSVEVRDGDELRLGGLFIEVMFR